jgi:hypothetical protein
MSLFPAYFGARKRTLDDSAPPAEPENESRADIFNLIPPSASDKYERPDPPAKAEVTAAPEVDGRGVHAVSAGDLSRLSIDNDGRLYWDGKPVEVTRRLTMSPSQVAGASLIGFFIVIGAIGSVLQATATVHDWACRSGLADSCSSQAPAPPAPKPPPARVDIPA